MSCEYIQMSIKHAYTISISYYYHTLIKYILKYLNEATETFGASTIDTFNNHTH